MVYRTNYGKKPKVSRNPYDTSRSDVVNRAGKSDQPQRSNTAGKSDKKPVGVKKVASATTPAAAPRKPASGAPKPTARPSLNKGPASGKMSFSGNWTGAAPSEMQKRGGARINRNGGILGAIKRKLGK